MFGCWRRTDAADPDTFITAVAAVLSDYPAEIVSRVTDPRTGLPGKQAFPPSAFEVKQACEAEMAPIRRQREREARYGETQRLLAAPVKSRLSKEQIRGALRGISSRGEATSGASQKAAATRSLQALSGLGDEAFAKALAAVPDRQQAAE